MAANSADDIFLRRQVLTDTLQASYILQRYATELLIVFFAVCILAYELLNLLPS
jgi:hypothetical protein